LILNTEQLNRSFATEDLSSKRSELEAMDLSDEFSFVSSALKVSLIRTIDFIETIINLDPQEGRAEIDNLVKDIDRNLLFAKLLLTEKNASNLSGQFRDAWNQVDLVWGATKLNEGKSAALAQEQRYYKTNGTPFLGASPEANSQGELEVKHFLLGDDESFDHDGMVLAIGLLFDSHKLIDKDFAGIKKFFIDARLFSKKDFFDEAFINKLEFPEDDMPGYQVDKFKETLASIFREYFSSNYAVRHILQQFLEENNLITEQAALNHYQENVPTVLATST
jgi:hypothetical protein